MLINIHREKRLFSALCIYTLLVLICTRVVFGHQIHGRHTKHISEKTPRGTVYFVGITQETYVPVSRNTIKRDADKVILLDDDDLAVFYSIIRQNGGTGEFTSSHVRVRLDDGKKPPLFIDQQGVVSCNNLTYSLTPFEFVELDHFIASLSSKK